MRRRVAGMKQILLMIALVALVGCASTSTPWDNVKHVRDNVKHVRDKVEHVRDKAKQVQDKAKQIYKLQKALPKCDIRSDFD